MSSKSLEKLASMLDGRIEGSEVNEDILDFATANDLVIVFGDIDSHTELRGIIEKKIVFYEELNSQDFFLNDVGDVIKYEDAGVFNNKIICRAKLIPKNEDYIYTHYSSNIYHVKFNIYDEENLLLCRGLVFSINSLD